MNDVKLTDFTSAQLELLVCALSNYCSDIDKNYFSTRDPKDHNLKSDLELLTTQCLTAYGIVRHRENILNN
jgi:hypothetical protein